MNLKKRITINKDASYWTPQATSNFMLQHWYLSTLPEFAFNCEPLYLIIVYLTLKAQPSKEIGWEHVVVWWVAVTGGTRKM